MVYIVLGVLYESLVHPLTILSTLPSAGVGAVLALLLFGAEFSLIALIGVILLIGIVKKNAIMMIDFALSAERNEGLDSRAAIYRACLLRFRPIMMTTMAAIFAALPLALITGRWRGTAPAVGDFDCRRAAGQSIADALHHPGCLSVSRPLLDLGQAILAAQIFRHFWSPSRSMTERKFAWGFFAHVPGRRVADGLRTGAELHAAFGARANGIQGDRRLDARNPEAGGGLGELVGSL